MVISRGTDGQDFEILTWKHVGTQKISTQSSKLEVSCGLLICYMHLIYMHKYSRGRGGPPGCPNGGFILMWGGMGGGGSGSTSIASTSPMGSSGALGLSLSREELLLTLL